MIRFRATSRILLGVILLEFIDGILGAYYTPLTVPLARSVGLHDSDWNWIEAAQTLLGAMVIPVLTKLGDRYGHKKALLASVTVTAGAAWWVVAGGGLVSVLIAFSLIAFNSAWGALELAVVRSSYGESAEADEKVSAASAALIVAFMVGSVGSALFGGQFFEATGGWAALEEATAAGIDPAGSAAFTDALRLTLLMPAAWTTLAIVLVAVFVRDTPPVPSEQHDLPGLFLFVGILVLLVGGLSAVKLWGPGQIWGWLIIAAAALTAYPFVRRESRLAQPTIDFKLLATRQVWPYQAAALLLGVGYNATQIPLVTFASTRPDQAGFGLAADSGDISVVMAVMILAISVTAGCLTAFGRRLDQLALLRIAPFIHAGEFILFAFFHTELWQAYIAVAVGGVGAGILVAWLPAAAANAAPPGKTATLVGLISLFQVVGVALGSAAFAIILGAVGHSTGPTAALSGYLTVFAVAVASSLAAGSLLRLARPPKGTNHAI
ncbi:MAG: MFS transporter [Propionibacteriaceae bacterium]|jgi:MFS family permease|nr:MFS transporter [Propionibacteriaceae bacterium]